MDMDLLDSCNETMKDPDPRRNLSNVRSWYFLEQYKSLQNNQRKAAERLRGKFRHDMFLHNELFERKERRRFECVPRPKKTHFELDNYSAVSLLPDEDDELLKYGEEWDNYLGSNCDGNYNSPHTSDEYESLSSIDSLNAKYEELNLSGLVEKMENDYEDQETVQKVVDNSSSSDSSNSKSIKTTVKLSDIDKGLDLVDSAEDFGEDSFDYFLAFNKNCKTYTNNEAINESASATYSPPTCLLLLNDSCCNKKYPSRDESPPKEQCPSRKGSFPCVISPSCKETSSCENLFSCNNPSPCKSSTPCKSFSPCKGSSPCKTPSLCKEVASCKGLSPSKISSPRKIMSPCKVSSPCKVLSGCKESPCKRCSPLKASSPCKVLTPSKGSFIRKGSSPHREASSLKGSSPFKGSSPRREPSPKKRSSTHKDYSPRADSSPRTLSPPCKKMSPRKISSPCAESCPRTELTPCKDWTPCTTPPLPKDSPGRNNCDNRCCFHTSASPERRKNIKSPSCVKKKLGNYGIFSMWRQLVCCANQIMKGNRGNCYCDYSKQVLMAILACDMIRISVCKISDILQPFILPVNLSCEDIPLTTMRPQKFKCRKNMSINKSCQSDSGATTPRATNPVASRSTDKLWSYCTANCPRSRQKPVIKDRFKQREPIIRQPIPRYNEYNLGKKTRQSCKKKCSCEDLIENPMLKVIQYMDDVLDDKS